MGRKKILITGGCGFIGHHFVEHFIKNTDYDLVVLDKLSYASSGYDRLRNIKCYDIKRVQVLACDLSNRLDVGLIKEIHDVNVIIHLAAETHVDNSIADAHPFVVSNVVGTYHILEAARMFRNLELFVYFSTDEVFGPAPDGVEYREWDRYNSGNPYAATKAGGEELTLAYGNTYKVPIIVTHTMNAFGERQHPEKFIPKTITKIMRGERVQIHSDPTLTVSGSRFYIHARNIASGVLFLLGNHERNDKYNIVGEAEVSNLGMAQSIARIIGKPLDYEMVDAHSSRPGHDLRYALNGSKMEKMGWSIPIPFEHSLEKTIRWYESNKDWLVCR